MIRFASLATVAGLLIATPAFSAPGDKTDAALLDPTGQPAGSLVLMEEAEGLTISGQAKGLTPGVHAIHIHEVGKCEPPFKSAGGHFNPTGKKHGRDNPEGSHLGDLSNITVGTDGTIRVIAEGLALDRGPDGLFDADGSSIVIHAKADDYKTDPTGNSGDRVICGVIEPLPE